MIKIQGRTITTEEFINQVQLNATEQKIIHLLSISNEVYKYDSLSQLKLELNLRSNIVNAAIELNSSKFAFRVFRKSFCNPIFWNRTDEGGFALQSGVEPSVAIQDIYNNSSKYGTECATAMIIVFYKALLDLLPVMLFNQFYSDIYLMNWKSLDKDLGLYVVNNPADFLPGDCMYFKNPEVDPVTPEWQGENVINLGDGKYYGHGIGITTADGIIEVLNRQRVSEATESAYLLPIAKRLSFKYISYHYNLYSSN